MSRPPSVPCPTSPLAADVWQRFTSQRPASLPPPPRCANRVPRQDAPRQSLAPRRVGRTTEQCENPAGVLFTLVGRPGPDARPGPGRVFSLCRIAWTSSRRAASMSSREGLPVFAAIHPTTASARLSQRHPCDRSRTSPSRRACPLAVVFTSRQSPGGDLPALCASPRAFELFSTICRSNSRAPDPPLATPLLPERGCEKRHRDAGTSHAGGLCA